MPQLLFRGIEQEQILKISKSLVDELVEIVGCPRDYFTLEHLPTQFIFDGQIVAKTPLVQINWFERGQEVRDKVALSLTKQLNSVGCLNVDVYFIALQGESYYENGSHF